MWVTWMKLEQSIDSGAGESRRVIWLHYMSPKQRLVMIVSEGFIEAKKAEPMRELKSLQKVFRSSFSYTFPSGIV